MSDSQAQTSEPGGIAWMFPGQGAQHVGMGVSLAETFPAARAVFDTASEVLGLDLLAICREGPDSELVRTDLQQPAILAVGAAAVAAMRSRDGHEGLAPTVAFGLSLGEFTALHAAGALELADALTLVRERGLGMQEASEAVPSGMSAMRTEAETAERICSAAREQTGGVISVANLNAPGQVVISGDLPSLDAAEAIAKAEHGIRRASRLPVAGAFHSALMEPGARRLAAALDKVEVHAPRIPVISNVTAADTRDPAVIRANLIAQVTSPVRFIECVERAAALGVSRTIETGPGRVLSGLVRRIAPDLDLVGAADAEQVQELTV